jgi:hypothetical protein
MDGAATTAAVISALISALALGGVALSLLLQVRQLKIAQLQASRAAQLELVKLAIENPGLNDTTDRWTADPAGYPRHAYVNLVFKYLELSFAIGALSERSVRVQVAYLFDSTYSREWWHTAAREVFFTEANSGRERRFAAIVDEVHGSCALRDEGKSEDSSSA